MTPITSGNDTELQTPAPAQSTAQTDGTNTAVRRVIGKVGSPPQREATSETFQFWVPRGELVEKTQIVMTESVIGGQQMRFFGLVDEVYRQSRKRSMYEEYDTYDGDPSYRPEFVGEGVTFASASILRAEIVLNNQLSGRSVLTPPMEQSDVYLGGAEDARHAYGADHIVNPLTVGIIKNGGSELAGPGQIDLDYLIGKNGGHLNVNGTAGRGTKSSYLLFIIHQLTALARQQQAARTSDPDRLRIVPIILNVKGFDLFHINQSNRYFRPDKDLLYWRALGVDNPMPFTDAGFFAPQRAELETPEATGSQSDVTPYSWSLGDVIERGLFRYMFGDEDANNANFSALVLDLEEWLTHEEQKGNGVSRRQLNRERGISTFQQLLDNVAAQVQNDPATRRPQGHEASTWRMLWRRLFKLVHEGNGVLRRHDQEGHPLNVVASDTTDPLVVDLNALSGVPSLQRFVVATILRQLIESRTGPNAIRGLVYLVALDELNRFAPRGSHDPITELVELVAAEMRSRGIILLGAQQQASKVSEKVIENSAIRVLGSSGSLELNTPTWRFLSNSARHKAMSLLPNEKLIMQDNFREPMHVAVPFPVWAMRRDEVQIGQSSTFAEPDNF